MASTTTAKRFHHDLRSLADGYGVLCLIAERKASVMARHSGHGTRSVAPIPLNLGAWQLRQDIDRLVESLATAIGLRYRHMDTVSLLKGIMRYEPRLLNRPDMPAIVELTRQAAIRLDRTLNPPPETKMIGWCPACGFELRCDELELKSGHATDAPENTASKTSNAPACSDSQSENHEEQQPKSAAYYNHGASISRATQSHIGALAGLSSRWEWTASARCSWCGMCGKRMCARMGDR